jgi:hypothetical protein
MAPIAAPLAHRELLVFPLLEGLLLRGSQREATSCD